MLKVIESNFSCTSPIQPPEQNSNSLWHTSFGVVTWKYLAKFLFFNLLWTQYSVKEEMCLLLYGATIVSCSFSLNQVWVTRKQDPGTVVLVFLHFCFFPLHYTVTIPFIFLCWTLYALKNIVIFFLIWLCIDFLVCAVGFLSFCWCSRWLYVWTQLWMRCADIWAIFSPVVSYKK